MAGWFPHLEDASHLVEAHICEVQRHWGTRRGEVKPATACLIRPATHCCVTLDEEIKRPQRLTGDDVPLHAACNYPEKCLVANCITQRCIIQACITLRRQHKACAFCKQMTCRLHSQSWEGQLKDSLPHRRTLQHQMLALLL